MRDCYISPQGEVYYGISHFDIAERIVKKVYSIDKAIIYSLDDADKQLAILCNPEKFLEENGWMKYINRCNIGWWIHLEKVPTQAQRDKIYELTGEVFEDKNLIWPCCVRSYLFIQKNLNISWEILRSRDGGDRTPGYGSEDRRVAITPHPYLLYVILNEVKNIIYPSLNSGWHFPTI